jgi:carbonic anhydrase
MRNLRLLIPSLLFIAACAVHRDAHAHWSYEGETGPAHWSELNPEFALCSKGKKQSPVDLARVEMKDLPDIAFNYQPAAVDIVNNGHTIQVNVDSGGSIELEGTTYALAQFHFHAPSEHTTDGRHARAELHLVHKSAAGGLAVVGVFLEEGETNPRFDPVWKHLAATPGASHRFPETVNGNDLLPADRRTIRYDGSLTTPPGTEGVRWVVMVEPVKLSATQLEALEKIIKGNNRPVQDLNGRVVIQDTVAH